VIPRRGWYTVGEAAAELGVTPSLVRQRIGLGQLAAEPVGERAYQIMPDALEAYRREHLGTYGWDKCKDPDYTPSRGAEYARAYRARKKAAAQGVADEAAAR